MSQLPLVFKGYLACLEERRNSEASGASGLGADTAVETSADCTPPTRIAILLRLGRYAHAQRILSPAETLSFIHDLTRTTDSRSDSTFFFGRGYDSLSFKRPKPSFNLIQSARTRPSLLATTQYLPRLLTLDLKNPLSICPLHHIHLYIYQCSTRAVEEKKYSRTNKRYRSG